MGNQRHGELRLSFVLASIQQCYAGNQEKRGQGQRTNWAHRTAGTFAAPLTFAARRSRAVGRFLRDGGRVLTVVLVTVLCGGAAFAQAAASEAVVLPFESAEFGLLVRAEIKGPKTPGRTVLLFVDTGASYTHLDARFLDLPHSSRSLRTMTGAGQTDLRVLEPVTLLFAERTFDLESLEVDLVAHRKLCSCDVAGVLGLDVLRGFGAVTLDFEAGTLTLRRKPQKKGEQNPMPI